MLYLSRKRREARIKRSVLLLFAYVFFWFVIDRPVVISRWQLAESKKNKDDKAT